LPYDWGRLCFHVLQDQVHAALQFLYRNAPVGGETDPAGARVDDHALRVELRFHFLGVIGLERHYAAAPLALAWRERLHAGLVASLEDAVGQVAQPFLDVRDTHLEAELQPRQPRVVAGHRPGSRFEPPSVVGEDELLERERERVPGRKPAGALRADSGDELGPDVQEGVARAPAEPLEASADESVAVHRL